MALATGLQFGALGTWNSRRRRRFSEAGSGKFSSNLRGHAPAPRALSRSDFGAQWRFGTVRSSLRRPGVLVRLPIWGGLF